jgi:hypothetical protein
MKKSLSLPEEMPDFSLVTLGNSARGETCGEDTVANGKHIGGLFSLLL